MLKPYKIERFIESLILAGTSGVKPLELTNKIQTNNISKYAYDLINKKGISLHTGSVYRITNLSNAIAALKLLNYYRVKRGAVPLPDELLQEWM